jgi:hypothetical protein
MGITYLDEEEPKSKIQYLDDQPQQGQQEQPQANVLQQLLQATGNAVGGMVGGVINEPARIIGRAGQQIESSISGQPPQNWTWEKSNMLGGNVDIKPAENWGQALAPVAGTALSMMALKGLVNPPKMIKFDNALKQAQKAKVALDETRGMLGKAKEIALQEVKDVPVKMDWAKNVSQKVVGAMKNPVYGVEFDESGAVKNTIGNLDKVKTALQDLVTTKDFVEAGNMEKRKILQFAGEIRDTMVNAANDVGKPELAKALKGYHEFMNNYNIINDKLVDKYGNAMANKLKTTFGVFSEQATKESWKEVAKTSPEIKKIMGSMNRRELLNNLLKVGGVGVGLGAGKTAYNWVKK